MMADGLRPDAQIVAPENRLPLLTVAPPHPAIWSLDRIESASMFRTQSRGGPGGQHRNKTASGVFWTFPFQSIDGQSKGEIIGEATEDRNQHRNRDMAMARLRLNLAIGLRTVSVLDQTDPAVIEITEADVRQRHRGRLSIMADTNLEKAAVLALLLNDLHAAGGQPSLAAKVWQASTSRIVSVLKSHPPAWTLNNQIRHFHARPPLR